MLISKEDLEQIFQEKDVLVVDARSFGEYSKGHIPGAVNLDLFAFHWFDTSQNGIDSFNVQTRKLLSFAGIDEKKKIVFYDNVSGMLASVRNKKLLLLGFSILFVSQIGWPLGSSSPSTP